MPRQRSQTVRPRVARNRAFIDEINARTFCAHCGAQPIEWHNFEHVELNRQLYRIGDMVQTGRAIASIIAELTRCTPLCRRCHMAEDGRLKAFAEAGRPAVQPPKPCAQCGQESKPLRRGLCHRCYEHRDHVIENCHLLDRTSHQRITHGWELRDGVWWKACGVCRLFKPVDAEHWYFDPEGAPCYGRCRPCHISIVVAKRRDRLAGARA